ncbi:MAG: DUF2326 domain-containing protein [Candidatus Omnitrophica bacterium]|nr:DUF2326 domain-containing protein [Candidatus Omnitrophota bacterium]
MPFQKGINLIVDETKTADKKESGNNVGKTTVLRLIDFCLGGDGKNIYQDTEFKNKSNTQIEQFLKNNDIIITLTLKEILDDLNSSEIEIKRNFLTYGEKIQEINGEKYSNPDFNKKLKELIFHSKADKPTFKQIISKNIRDERNRLVNTVKVLDSFTTQEEYEALYLFWLGIDLDSSDRKQRLISQRKIEENLQKRLRKESSLSQVVQSLLVINRLIEELEAKKDIFNPNENFNEELSALNQIKSDINRYSTEIGGLELRKELIIESKEDLEKDFAEIDIQQIERLYLEAKSLIPSIQKSYEETLIFHNQMVKEKIRYITKELPGLENSLLLIKGKLTELLNQEKSISDRLVKTGVMEGLQQTILELSRAYEKKGSLEEQKRLWESSMTQMESIDTELSEINRGILSKDDLIQERVSEFNKYFSKISSSLYGEQFVLSTDKNAKGYELNISSLSGNLGTGKKKGQIAAFDLAYVQFADSLGIDCLHFILQDQIENVHDNQISNLLTEIVSGINCQFVLPVLRDKLPEDIDVKQYEILTLSQADKLFKL